MSRLFEAIKRMETERHPSAEAPPDPSPPIEFLAGALAGTPKTTAKTEELISSDIVSSATPKLVALSDRQSLGAEKFRALATRIENIRREGEFKSLQVTSGSVAEGKTLVAGNLAATLAIQTNSSVLLIEGDLHRPALIPLFGIRPLEGLSHWWSRPDEEIARYVHKIKGTSLSLLAAGKAWNEPSQLLQSSRFATAFRHLAERFDWIVVDSAPMLPTVSANLWSRLVDGTLLVVREGVARVRDLRNGLEALDSPKLIGIVMNDASGALRANYRYYYGNAAGQSPESGQQ
jgi:capsular exopolysaccharide synthesis family protein